MRMLVACISDAPIHVFLVHVPPPTPPRQVQAQGPPDEAPREWHQQEVPPALFCLVVPAGALGVQRRARMPVCSLKHACGWTSERFAVAAHQICKRVVVTSSHAQASSAPFSSLARP